MAGLLNDGRAVLEHLGLPVDFVGDGPLHRPQRVHVLHLGTDTEPVRTQGPERDVGIEPHRTFLELGIRDAEGSDDALQLRPVRPGLLGAANVRFGHYLNQRHPGTVEIEERVLRAMDATGLTLVETLAGVLLHMDPGDSDADRLAVDLEVEVPVNTDRKGELRYLIVLWQVGVEVVLPIEQRSLSEGAVECFGDGEDPLDGLFVRYRQCTWKRETHRAHRRVRLVSEVNGTPAEHLGRGLQLDVGLDADHRLPGGHGSTSEVASLALTVNSAARSTSAATRNISPSPRAGAMTWNPMGKPASSSATGTDIAGSPERFDGMVHTSE